MVIKPPATQVTHQQSISRTLTLQQEAVVRLSRLTSIPIYGPGWMDDLAGRALAHWELVPDPAYFGCGAVRRRAT